MSWEIEQHKNGRMVWLREEHGTINIVRDDEFDRTTEQEFMGMARISAPSLWTQDLDTVRRFANALLQACDIADAMNKRTFEYISGKGWTQVD